MEDYLSILKDLHQTPVHENRDVLILDGLNCFLRSFAVATAINPKGHNVGGLTGFLKTLCSLKRQFSPRQVIVAWDGKGGATNRKHLNSNYKAQRAQSSVIHWDIYDSKEEESQSIRNQIERLEDYLECLPIKFIRLDKLEADDVIAYVAKKLAGEGDKVTVVSSDKDFLQLVSENIRVYSPTKKVLYDYSTTLEFLGVLPENYNITKALVGDKSDNLRGVQGAGIKTLVKLLPELLTDRTYNLDRMFEDCQKMMESKKVCANILVDWNRVENNFKLMDLHSSVLSEAEKEIIQSILDEPTFKLQVGKFMMLLDQDCISDIVKDTEGWLLEFSDLK